MAELRIPEPSEKQCLFMADRHKYIGYGGARGGGKSWAVRVKAVLLCLRYAGIKVMIIRKTYPELQENHIIPLCEMLGCYADESERIASYNDGKKHIVFPNGSRILFRYCDNDKDALRFQGTEVDVLFVDEATQQSEEKMEKLRACVRGVNDFPKRVYYTCNPGGEGHAWVKRLFIDRRFKEGEEPEDHSFIQSLITDNTALMEADPQYIKQLEALPPKLRDAWLYGNWEIFEGQFFEDFRTEPDMRAAEAHGESLTAEELRAQRRWVHVIEPFDLNAGSCRGWRIMRSYDFGYGKPFSCAWWAIDYVGVIYRILASVAHDLRQDEGWIEAHKYAAPDALFNGEIGELHGVRFIENVFAPVLGVAGESADGDDEYVNKSRSRTYATYFFGKDSFGIIDPEGGALEMIVHDKGEIGGPLNQFSTIGYKFETNGATILYPERLLRVMSCSSFSASDETN